jgi:predicted dehydrogenase
LDLLLSLTGDVTEVQAMVSTTAFHDMEAEDYVTAALRFADGAAGSVIASTASYPCSAESITLQFDNASADLRSGILKITWRNGTEELFGAQATTGGGADPMAFTHDWHAGIIADFADALSAGRPPLVTGREALKVHRLIDAIITSSQQKCSVEVSQ